MSATNYLEDTRAYYSEEFKKRILFELFTNALRTYQSVYVFKNYDEFVRQYWSDTWKDKGEVYWAGAYYEKLIDYVKIIIAFETYNKAVLLREGYLVHSIKSGGKNKEFHKLQKEGKAIKVSDFLSHNTFVTDKRLYSGKTYLEGLSDSFQTIKFSQTLNSNYQEIIKLDSNFIHYLRKVNYRRNRLHYFTEFKGANSVRHYLNELSFAKDYGTEVLKTAADIAYKATPY